MDSITITYELVHLGADGEEDLVRDMTEMEGLLFGEALQDGLPEDSICAIDSTSHLPNKTIEIYFTSNGGYVREFARDALVEYLNNIDSVELVEDIYVYISTTSLTSIDMRTTILNKEWLEKTLKHKE